MLFYEKILNTYIHIANLIIRILLAFTISFLFFTYLPDILIKIQLTLNTSNNGVYLFFVGLIPSFSVIFILALSFALVIVGIGTFAEYIQNKKGSTVKLK